MFKPYRMFSRVIGLLLLSSVAVAQEPQLTIDAVNRPLVEILADITADTGVVFDLQTEIDTLVTLKLNAEPLASALRQLLTGHDYLMQHDSTSGMLTRVMIMVRRPSAQESVATASIQPRPVRMRELVVRRRGDQPFIVPGRINGQAVELLIDTGATTVAVSQELAQRLGLVRGESRQIATASGTTIGYTTVLRRITLGELQLDNVRAIILPAMRSGRQVLLGMNALGQLELNQSGDTLVLRQAR